MSRHPARQRSRKPDGTEQLLLTLGGLDIAAAVVAAVADFLRAHPWVPIGLVLLVGGAAAWVVTRRRDARWERVRSQGLRYALTRLDALHHRRFEHAVRDLMRRDGCANAVQVGGAGDNGADVKPTDPYGRRWVIQCKHRRAGLPGAAVGAPDLQVLNGTGRPVHKGDVVALVTKAGTRLRPLPAAAPGRPHHAGQVGERLTAPVGAAGRATASSAPVCLTGSLTKEPWAGLAGRRYP